MTIDEYFENFIKGCNANLIENIEEFENNTNSVLGGNYFEHILSSLEMATHPSYGKQILIVKFFELFLNFKITSNFLENIIITLL